MNFYSYHYRFFIDNSMLTKMSEKRSYWGTISSWFYRNSETLASELLENLEKCISLLILNRTNDCRNYFNTRMVKFFLFQVLVGVCFWFHCSLVVITICWMVGVSSTSQLHSKRTYHGGDVKTHGIRTVKRPIHNLTF